VGPPTRDNEEKDRIRAREKQGEEKESP